MVAKSYQNMEIVHEPFQKNGRMYVEVKTSKGTIKQVRWYTEVEYAKMYPEDKTDKTKDPYYKPQKYVLGFDKGYITIFRGVKEEHEEWFKQSICRFARWWGWYVISTQEVPKDLPEGVEPVRLDWEPMDNGNEWLKEEKEVVKYVQSVLFKKTNSKVQGNVGDRIERTVRVIDRIEQETKWGTSIIHIMKDEKDNLYSWKTSTKNWQKNYITKIRGTVKGHMTYKNSECTELTRCTEI